MTVEQRNRLDSLMTIRHNAYQKAKHTEFAHNANLWREANREYVQYRDSLKSSLGDIR
jgi:hypothetical protein